MARFDGAYGADWPTWAPGAAYARLARVGRQVTGEQVCLRRTELWHAAHTLTRGSMCISHIGHIANLKARQAAAMERKLVFLVHTPNRADLRGQLFIPLSPPPPKAHDSRT